VLDGTRLIEMFKIKITWKPAEVQLQVTGSVPHSEVSVYQY